MPRYRFKGTNLPQSLLKALCRDLLDADNHDRDPAAALHANYGARPNQEFIREAWPTLLESWLRITKDSRDGVEEALRQVRGENGSLKRREAQMKYLRGLRNSKNLRRVVWQQLVAIGEIERQREHLPEGGARKGRSSPVVDSHAQRKQRATRHPSPVASQSPRTQAVEKASNRPRSRSGRGR